MLGLFRQPEEVAQALDALRAAGFAEHELEVLSDSPYPEGAFGEAPPTHRLYVFPLVGAACGLAIGLLLTIGTQLSYPVVTGGKPVISVPPMINVLYEGTLLGAIIFTVLGVLFESRLPDYSRLPYDPRISEGYLGVLVLGAGARAEAAEQALRAAGAIDVIVEHRPPRRRAWAGVLTLGLLAIAVAGCNAGAYPNDLFNEMHYQPSQRRLEPDRLSPPDDAVPVTGGHPAHTFAEAAGETNPVPRTTQTMERAQALYATNCAMCHGADGHGKGPIAAYFAQSGATVPPVDLASDRVRGRTDGELHWIIDNGLGGMPAFRPLLTDDDVWRLVSFIRSLQGS